MLNYTHTTDEYNPSTTLILKYDGVEDMWDHLQSVSKRKIESADWVGRHFNNYQEIHEAMQSEWRTGMDLYYSILEEIRSTELPLPQTIKRAQVWSDVEGEEFCFDRFQSDKPFLRTTSKRTRVSVKTVTIVANLASGAQISPENLVGRTAAITALIEILEAAGYRVGLHSSWMTENSHYKRTTNQWRTKYTRTISSVELKQPNDPIDHVLFVNTMSSWCHRTLFHSTPYFWEQHGYSVEENLGFPCSIKGTSMMGEITADHNAIESYKIFGRSANIEWIKQAIEQITQTAVTN